MHNHRSYRLAYQTMCTFSTARILIPSDQVDIVILIARRMDLFSTKAKLYYEHQHTDYCNGQEFFLFFDQSGWILGFHRSKLDLSKAITWRNKIRHTYILWIIEYYVLVYWSSQNGRKEKQNLNASLGFLYRVDLHHTIKVKAYVGVLTCTLPIDDPESASLSSQLLRLFTQCYSLSKILMVSKKSMLTVNF